jgi:hypothetical protein
MARTKWWLYALLFFPALGWTQTNHAPAAVYPANRFLLIVETSHSMLHRSEAMAQTVQDLLKTSLARQARRGDSLGVWTFNEELYTGLLSLQQWTPENQKAITDRVVGFLRAQKFEKKSRLDKVIPALNGVVRNSSFLTVILVCVGDEEVHGTPFDERINQFFQSWRQQQLDARTPFVIALRAQGGAFVDCSMNPAPWPPELPALPKELFVTIPVARAPTSEPRRQATSSVPPLIISGRKHESSPALTNTAPSTPTTAAAIPGASNSIPQPVSSSNADKAPEPSPTAAAAAVVQPTTAATPVSTSSPPPVAAAQIPPARLVEAAPQLPPPLPHPQTPERSETSVATTEKTTKEPGHLAGMLAANVGTTAITAETLAPSAPTRAQPKPSTGQPIQAVNSDARPPAVDVASIDTSRNRSRTIVLGLAGMISLGTILTAIWAWRRRTRSASGEASLITESIDRRKR